MFFTSWISNSFEDDASSKGKDFPNNNNNYHFRDSSSDSSDGEISAPTSPISPISPISSISSISPISQSNGTTFNINNHNTPNMQRRASETITEAFQFKKLQPRRNTLPGKFGLSRFFEQPGRDSSVQVAMEHCQFGL